MIEYKYKSFEKCVKEGERKKISIHMNLRNNKQQ